MVEAVVQITHQDQAEQLHQAVVELEVDHLNLVELEQLTLVVEVVDLVVVQ